MDKKYIVITDKDEKLLLRISDRDKYDVKKKEYEIITKYSKLGIRMSMPLAFGICENGKKCICFLAGLRE